MQMTKSLYNPDTSCSVGRLSFRANPRPNPNLIIHIAKRARYGKLKGGIDAQNAK